MAIGPEHNKSPKASRFGTKSNGNHAEKAEYVPKGMNSRRPRAKTPSDTQESPQSPGKEPQTTLKSGTKRKPEKEIKPPADTQAQEPKPREAKHFKESAKEGFSKAKHAGSKAKSAAKRTGSVLLSIPAFFAGAYKKVKDFIDNDPKAQSASGNKPNKFANFFRNNLVFILVSTGLLIMAFLAIYFPAKDYYVAYRHNERLQYEYVENMQRNKKIEDRVKNLQTPEGIEDYARKELNMVKPGENSVNVVGGPEESETAQPPAVVERIPQGSGTAPSNWKTRFLDFFFGVGDTSTGKSDPDKNSNGE